MAGKPATQSPWKNRIVGYAEEPPEQLLASPWNWRVHPQAQQEALEGVLDSIGWVQNVIVNQRTGFVVDGHARIRLALRHGAATVPVTYVDLSEAEERLVLATYDPLAAQAVTDPELLGLLLQDVESHQASVQELLATVAQDAVDPSGEPTELFPAREEEAPEQVCPQCGRSYGG